MTRVFAMGLILLTAQAAPTFAEKVTLACSHGGDYIILYYTFDMSAMRVMSTENPRPGPYAIKVTDDQIYWKDYIGQDHVYDRHAAQLTVNFQNGPSTIQCRLAPKGPL
jgi:hypothetical protein